MGRRRRQIPAPDELSGIRPVASGKGCLDKKKDVNMYLIYKDSATRGQKQRLLRLCRGAACRRFFTKHI